MKTLLRRGCGRCCRSMTLHSNYDTTITAGILKHYNTITHNNAQHHHLLPPSGFSIPMGHMILKHVIGFPPSLSDSLSGSLSGSLSSDNNDNNEPHTLDQTTIIITRQHLSFSLSLQPRQQSRLYHNTNLPTAPPFSAISHTAEIAQTV